MARQASGALTIRQGDTVVLVTAQAANSARDIPFLPLTVEYRENMYAGGKIPGGFFKREGRPNEKETLTARLTDRPLRPLFPDGWAFETQVIALVLSADREHNPDVLAVTGASFALSLSDIPWSTPIAAVRMGLVDGEYLVNPTHEEMKKSKLDIIVAASEEAIVMVEAGAVEASEEEIITALFKGQEACQPLIAAQKELAAEAGKPKREFTPPEIPADLVEKVRATARGPLLEAMQIENKLDSYAQVGAVLDGLLAEVPEDQPEQAGQIKKIFHDLQDEILHDFVLTHKRRLDGRKLDEIRKVTIDVGVLPRTHGSALFTRGETQALVLTTLGTASDTQRIDSLEFEGEKRFMLHYNFPPFSVGEVRFLRGPGRREIGHGALAERALRPMIPSVDDFPYTIRVVSDILESNGSSSMASVCGGSLSLMDAGVPLRKPVAGIAMGLVMQGSDFAVLTDIAGAEDHHGDMDFKVTGTVDGITALQMDIKIGGVTREVMSQALEQARKARFQLLDMMNEVLAKGRDDVSPYAPRIITVWISKDKIRDVIGPGGKVIRSIQEQTGCDISIEDDGRVDIASVDLEGARRAAEIVKELTAEAELNKIYMGRVVRTTNFGAFVEILPGVEGLLHISEIAEHRVKNTTDEIEEGDEVLVKVIDIDAQGRVRLSRKAAMREKAGH
ncbi:MAG: polyribonucleotide nucleotidyltransferase [Acidobacteriota bacterium]|nr:polyribonucleotide nucleotidyltransferase [Acidobacteriota bacterium]MDQ7087946.1 polyribonucleotide nucleotidyltransferase [Acidobacteriota bacterium]